VQNTWGKVKDAVKDATKENRDADAEAEERRIKSERKAG
jgi:hypothetical protein